MLILAERMGYHSIKFRCFPDISFPMIPHLISCSNLYMPCLQVIIAHCFPCGDRKICENIKKSRNIMKMIAATLLVIFIFMECYVIKFLLPNYLKAVLGAFSMQVIF